MADLIVETGAGLATANSYISLDDADLYHEMHLYVTDWTGASDDTKEAALMWATRLLDERVGWTGWKSTTTQALRWPRGGVYTPDGDLLSSSAVPQFLENATAEYARLLIASDLTAVSALAGFKKLEVDVIKLEVDKYDSRSDPIPESVWSMISYYGNKMGKRNKILVRV